MVSGDEQMKLKYSAKAHGYWLDGKRCKSPSAIAKVPDDQSGLTKWKLRQALTGVALRPELATRIAAANGDKDALDAICEEAIHAAGGNSGRDRGTAVHGITEHLDGGVTLLETPEVTAIREQYQTLMARYGLEVVQIEGVIVHPDLMVAGRFDRIVKCPDGKLRIADVKTGESADKYLHSHCTQLWLYASAPLLATGPQGDQDFEVTEFAPMPAVDQDIAYVIHLPAEGDGDIIGVDIAAGRDCFHNVITPIWGWRSRKNLRVPVDAVIQPPMPRTTNKNNTATPPPRIAPDEGRTGVNVDSLRDKYKALDPAARSWVEAKRGEAQAAGVDFHLATPTERRAWIMSALCNLAAAEVDDDDTVKAIARHVTGDDACGWPTVTAGHAVGSLDVVQAKAFRDTALVFAAGMGVLEFDELGAKVAA
jgi:hypothetical protein